MSESNAFSHLTLEERRIILIGITNGSTKTAIAQTIGKDKSTVGKEIRMHRTITHLWNVITIENVLIIVSALWIVLSMSLFTAQDVTVLPVPATVAPTGLIADLINTSIVQSYRITLIDSREGVNLTFQEAKAMADIIKTLLGQGQSPFQIVTNHPELSISEKTLYNYIENDVFHEIAEITIMDLRR